MTVIHLTFEYVIFEFPVLGPPSDSSIVATDNTRSNILYNFSGMFLCSSSDCMQSEHAVFIHTWKYKYNVTVHCK